MVEPSRNRYTVKVDGATVGTATYQSDLVPTDRIFLEEDANRYDYLKAWYDDFQVYGTPKP